MDLAANELSIYDKLSETVDLVRQTGHQCGMSEKAIEKFIRQLLEKNEPQRGPPQYPLLIAVYKVLVTLGLILLTAYFVIQPFSALAPEPVLSGPHAWRSLIHHIRLMSLPITKKYMPENKGVPLPGGDEDRPIPAHPPSDVDPWWTNSCEQNESDPIPANCTGCTQKLPLQVVLLGDAPQKFERLHPLVIKTAQPLSPEEIQHISCQYPEAMEGFAEGFFTKWWRCFPERWFPFPYPWRSPLNTSQVLHELFPVFKHLPFPKDASLKKCFLLHPEPVTGSKMHRMHDLFTVGSGEAMLQLIPPFHCRRHCQSVAMPIEAGDIGTFPPRGSLASGAPPQAWTAGDSETGASAHTQLWPLCWPEPLGFLLGQRSALECLRLCMCDHVQPTPAHSSQLIPSRDCCPPLGTNLTHPQNNPQDHL
ncbi:bombesin receptor-activated protein C6orf89 homolog isoform X3 [Ochotona curzoniae]|nr:bombesin receptor-activated protein C6orf89 homolog isoform X3 [Ochotona curzoniae]XP_040839216.1 bombesin receptor-activated protein C6orf89 homolog isoform X3 [Ochotona curzoniae]